MPPRLVQFIAGGETCVVATVDETGRPNTTLMTWVVARNPQTVTMAVDQRDAPPAGGGGRTKPGTRRLDHGSRVTGGRFG